MSQKFHRGDLVHVAADLGPTMSHFSGADSDALIVGSYEDQYPGGSGRKQYTLWLLPEGRGTSSWYHEDQLTLLKTRTFEDVKHVERLIRNCNSR